MRRQLHHTAVIISSIRLMMTATVLITLSAGMASADDDVSRAERHVFSGFTRPFRSINISAAGSGRVSDVVVQPGQRVTAGQLLLKLDTAVLEASRLRAVRDAESVSRINALTVEAELAERRVKNVEQLSTHGGSSSEEYQRAAADLKIAKFNLSEARENQQQLQAIVGEIDAQIEERHVRSTIDGLVTDVLFEHGEHVTAAEPQVATVVDLSRLRATFFLPTKDALALRRGVPFRLTLPETEQSLTARLDRVAEVTQANSGRVRVEVIIDNEQNEFRSGLRCLLDAKSVDLAKTAAPVLAGLPQITDFSNAATIKIATPPAAPVIPHFHDSLVADETEESSDFVPFPVDPGEWSPGSLVLPRPEITLGLPLIQPRRKL